MGLYEFENGNDYSETFSNTNDLWTLRYLTYTIHASKHCCQRIKIQIPIHLIRTPLILLSQSK